MICPKCEKEMMDVPGVPILDSLSGKDPHVRYKYCLRCEIQSSTGSAIDG